jgi:hypothetical protein
VERWPKEGKHILAQYNSDYVVVYQAYCPSIGYEAASQGHFLGGGFSLNRMSWIKTNFLWMMYRSGWGTKLGQEVILAIKVKRDAFAQILAASVPSTFKENLYLNQEEWQEAVKNSAVRLQWDPDHDPLGNKLERRAIQLGLRDEFLKLYAKDWLKEIEDISDFVKEQRQYVESKQWEYLVTPQESVYPVSNSQIATKLGLSI